MMDQKQGGTLATTTLKIIHAHFTIINIFSYFLLVLSFCLVFGITVGFYSANFSLIRLQTPKPFSVSTEILTAPSPSSPPKKAKGTVMITDLSATSPLSSSTKNKVMLTNQYHRARPRPIHSMSDDELMLKASKMVDLPLKRQQVPKIAFMFLVKGSLPLAPLWEKFFKGHEGFYNIYVHSDPSFNSSSEIENGVFLARRIPSQVVEWGKFNMIEAELRLLANALLDPSNQRFVLLSESCIPLFNFTTIYSYLMNSSQSYVEAYDSATATGRGRYKHQLWPTVTLREWRKGSQWFEINRKMALKVISDQGYFQSYKRACKSACYADEHYLPTWMTMNGGDNNANRSLTYVDWSKRGCHPSSYRRLHVTVEFLERLRSEETCEYNGKSTSICYLFARKFLPDALDRLLRFAPKVMHF